jgi:hypothetical protein
MPSHSSPETPGIPVEPGRDTKTAFNAARQDNGLKRIHQDDEDQNYAED